MPGCIAGLLDLKASLDRWRALPPDADAAQRDALAALIQAQAAAVDLAAAEPAWTDDAERRSTGCRRRAAGAGIHADPAWPACRRRAAECRAARAEMLDAAGVTDAAERRAAGRAAGRRITKFRRSCMRWMAAIMRPAPGGDLLRTTDVLPTGRNLHGFDPFRIPSAFAVQDGARQADRLLARHAADGAGAARDGGDGAVGHRQPEDRRRPDRAGAVADGRRAALRQLRPACRRASSAAGDARAGRAIDVVVDAVRHLPRPAAAADEAAGRGGAAGRDRRRAARSRTSSASTRWPSRPSMAATIEDAALRVFGNADGAYGANVNHLIGSGAWNDEDELADAYRPAQGLRLRRRRPAAAGTTRCSAHAAGAASTSPIRTSTRSSSA